jgi:iron complex transport system ATP-binding protein
LPAIFELSNVSLRRDRADLLTGVSWTVRERERWAVLGPNGAGKTSLLQLLATYAMPSDGSLSVLGHRVGQVDVRELRARLGYLSPALNGSFTPHLTPHQLVDAAQVGAIVHWYIPPEMVDKRRSRVALAAAGALDHMDRTFSSLASGEQARVLLARALVSEPEALLLDEPMSHLDIEGREALHASLAGIDALPNLKTVVLVVHRVEDIPQAFTHVLLLRQGRVKAAGPLEEALTEANLSECFGIPLQLARVAGRYVAVGAGARAAAVSPSTEQRAVSAD